MRNHRITKPDFRPCSTCRSRSQTPLCLYTLRMISNHSEGTFGRLRYLFRRRPPSQTAHLTLSPPDKGGRLKVNTARVISHRCLHRSWRSGFQGSYLSCTSCTDINIRLSKAPRGLSVLSRVPCIFTGTIISPSLSLRQCPDRCAFRAGRNLPDKEFRYLRTVIVTAAVYWGFNSHLRLR